MPTLSLPLDLTDEEAGWLYTLLHNTKPEFANGKTRRLIALVERMPFPETD